MLLLVADAVTLDSTEVLLGRGGRAGGEGRVGRVSEPDFGLEGADLPIPVTFFHLPCITHTKNSNIKINKSTMTTRTQTAQILTIDPHSW